MIEIRPPTLGERYLAAWGLGVVMIYAFLSSIGGFLWLHCKLPPVLKAALDRQYQGSQKLTDTDCAGAFLFGLLLLVLLIIGAKSIREDFEKERKLERTREELGRERERGRRFLAEREEEYRNRSAQAEPLVICQEPTTEDLAVQAKIQRAARFYSLVSGKTQENALVLPILKLLSHSISAGYTVKEVCGWISTLETAAYDLAETVQEKPPCLALSMVPGDEGGIPVAILGVMLFANAEPFLNLGGFACNMRFYDDSEHVVADGAADFLRRVGKSLSEFKGVLETTQ